MQFGSGCKRKPRFPDGGVGFAVGDIHGRADLLARMFEVLERSAGANGHAPVVIFLGDYIDRGPDSAEVLELLQTGRPEGFERRFLMGNHEQAALAFIDDPARNRQWLLHGGQETIRSYGIAPPPWGASQAQLVETAERLKRAIPGAHMAFLRGLERIVVIGDYAFVHAGVDPARTVSQQQERDLLWVREPFLSSRKPFSHFVVHGHTPGPEPYCDERRICLDTGAYATDRLGAARFEAARIEFLLVEAPSPATPLF